MGWSAASARIRSSAAATISSTASAISRSISRWRPDPIFLGTAPFEASQALQVRYDIVCGHTIVQFYSAIGPVVPPADVTGAIGEIELVGCHRLAASDFLLA